GPLVVGGAHEGATREGAIRLLLEMVAAALLVLDGAAGRLPDLVNRAELAIGGQPLEQREDRPGRVFGAGLLEQPLAAGREDRQAQVAGELGARGGVAKVEVARRRNDAGRLALVVLPCALLLAPLLAARLDRRAALERLG